MIVCLRVIFLAVCFILQTAQAHEPLPENFRSRPGGSQGRVDWEPLLVGEGLEAWTHWEGDQNPGTWKREGDSLIGETQGRQRARISIGDETWQSYELSCKMKFSRGSSFQIAFRVSDDRSSYYALDFLFGWDALSVSRRDGDTGEFNKKSVIPFNVEKDREYEVVVAVLGHSITTHVDGIRYHQMTDEKYPVGGVGFMVWHNGTVEFRDIKIRHFYKKVR